MPRTSLYSLIASFALVLLFAAVAWRVVGGERLPDFDRIFAHNVKEISTQHQFRREAMVFFTIMGGIPAMTVLAIFGGIWQWQRNERVLAFAWVAIVLSGGLVNLGLKVCFDRERPPQEWRDRFVHENNESFPSGHSMGAIIGYGMLAYAVLLSVERRWLRLTILVLLALWVGLIGFSRMYLRAHWFSDVVAGFLVGLAWLEFCLAWVEWGRWRRRQAPVVGVQ